jgi:ABC-type multidrug transport system fused ATPase/permease subunit
MLAGVAGGLHAVALRGIGQSTYPASTSLLVFSMAVIGGVSSVGGTLAGVALVQWAGYLFPKAQLLLTGVGLLAILLVIPGGLAQAFERWRDRFVHAVALRRGMVSHDEIEMVEQAVEPGHTAAIHRDAAGPGLRVGSVRRERLGTHLLTCEGIEASYGTLQVLFGVDLGVERNELIALLGTNGAGKSTVLKSVAGLLPSSAGRITFDGRDITGLPAEETARLGLSLMPGGKGVFPTLTVAENLRLACWMLRHDPWRCCCATAPCSSRRARCGSGARPPVCSTVPTSCAPSSSGPTTTGPAASAWRPRRCRRRGSARPGARPSRRGA